jgi:hypothetical protein
MSDEKIGYLDWKPRAGENRRAYRARVMYMERTLSRLHASGSWRDLKHRLDDAESIAEHGYVDHGS